MRLSEERVRMSEERMRLSEERMRMSEERRLRSEERPLRMEEKPRRRQRESSSRRSSRGAGEDRLPRAYQINIQNYQTNKSQQDSSDNKEASPSPPPFNAVNEGCETNVDPY